MERERERGEWKRGARGPNRVAQSADASLAAVCLDPENYRLAEADGATCVKLMPEWSKGYVRQATALFYQKKYKGEQRTLAHSPHLLFRCDGTYELSLTVIHSAAISLFAVSPAAYCPPRAARFAVLPAAQRLCSHTLLVWPATLRRDCCPMVSRRLRSTWLSLRRIRRTKKQ